MFCFGKIYKDFSSRKELDLVKFPHNQTLIQNQDFFIKLLSSPKIPSVARERKQFLQTSPFQLFLPELLQKFWQGKSFSRLPVVDRFNPEALPHWMFRPLFKMTAIQSAEEILKKHRLSLQIEDKTFENWLQKNAFYEDFRPAKRTLFKNAIEKDLDLLIIFYQLAGKLPFSIGLIPNERMRADLFLMQKLPAEDRVFLVTFRTRMYSDKIFKTTKNIKLSNPENFFLENSGALSSRNPESHRAFHLLFLNQLLNPPSPNFDRRKNMLIGGIVQLVVEIQPGNKRRDEPVTTLKTKNQQIDRVIIRVELEELLKDKNITQPTKDLFQKILKDISE